MLNLFLGLLNKMTFEEIKLAKEMKELREEIEAANLLEEIEEDYAFSLEKRKRELLTRFYQMKHGDNVVPLVR